MRAVAVGETGRFSICESFTRKQRARRPGLNTCDFIIMLLLVPTIRRP